MLKRAPEKHWKFTQPTGGDSFPPAPCRGTFVAPSGGGKTSTICSLLLGPYKNVFAGLYVFSPSVSIDSAWDPVEEHAKHLKHRGFFSEWDEGALRSILDKQREEIRELKKAKTHKPLPQVLLVIHDFADSPVMHNATNILTTLLIRGRHLGCSTWLSTQHLTAVSRIARVNVSFECVWRQRNAKEIEMIIEELSAIYPKDVLLQMYHLAVNDEDFSFWYINLTARPRPEFYIRFEKRILVKE